MKGLFITRRGKEEPSINNEQVKYILSTYRELQATHAMHMALHQNDQQEATQQRRQKIDIMESWLQILSAEERFVITQRLMNLLPWPMISVEYEMRWGRSDGKSERTLKRQQAKALSKIASFIKQSGYEPLLTRLFLGSGN